MRLPRSRSLRTVLLTAVAASALILAGCSGGSGSDTTKADGSSSSEWSYKDATGTTITVDHTPKRVIALNDIAISMVQYGLHPVATFGQLTTKQDKRWEGLDTDGIEDLGTGYGDIDLEKVASLKPDLILTSIYPVDEKGTLDKGELGYGFKDADQEKQLEAIAPVAKVFWGGDGEDVIKDITGLATSLGAKQSTVDAAKQDFDDAAAGLKAETADHDVQVTTMYADSEGVYVVRPADEPMLQLYEDYGADLTVPKPKGYYWGIYSWENAGQVTGDMIMLSQQGYQVADLEKQPTFADNAALQAGQVHTWVSPALDYASQAESIEQLTDWIKDSEKL